MAVTAKGEAEFIVNPEETEAKLVFTAAAPDNAEAVEWDADKVARLAGEAKLSPAPAVKDVEVFLSKVSREAKAGDKLELVLYTGTPPEEAAAESVAWEAAELPAGIAEVKDEVLERAGPPELYVVKVEKIKKETVVKKAGALPFLPGKEETVVTWNKKETREKAEVDPAVAELHYAEKGKKCGTVSPAVPGKPGKNVFGRPIPPKPLPESGYLFGKGLSRDKNDLIPDYSGLLRIGAGWADIVPLAKPSWSVDKGTDGVTFFFKFEPGDKRFALPTGKEIIETAVAKGAAEALLVSAESLDDEIAEAAAAGHAAFTSLFKVQEGGAVVTVNQDKTLATLTLRKGVAGGRQLDMAQVSQALKDSKVSGYDGEKLKADLKAFFDGPETEMKDYVLAEGKPSTRGKDREIQLSIKLLESDAAKPVVARLKHWEDPLSRGAILDLDGLMGVAPVKKGDVIIKISSGGAGEAGKDIFGKEIPAIPGNDPEVNIRAGLEQHGSTVMASTDGMLLVTGDERHFTGQIVPYKDGRISVHISDDGMQAFVDLEKETGAGVPLHPDLLNRALASLGIKQGVDRAAIEAACSRARIQGVCTGTLAARGIKPVAPGGAELVWLLPEQPGPGKTVSVKAGQPLADMVSGGAEGRSGCTVKGEEIPASRAAAYEITHDDSIKEMPADPKGQAAGKKGVRLAAVCGGDLSFENGELKISGLKEMDAASGDVVFGGEIRISGAVKPGSTIDGGGSVLVGGRAEGCRVFSGGKVLAAGGLTSLAVVRAHKTVEAPFVEQAVVLAVDDVFIKERCIDANIKTNGLLLIDSPIGRMEGGVCRARKGINVQDLGSEKGRRTEISFGQDYLLRDQIELTETQIGKAKETLKKIDLYLKKMAKSPKALASARQEKVKLMKGLKQLNVKIFTLREKFEEHFDSEIRVRGTVFPGVVMESHNRYYEVNRARGGAVFYFDRKTGRILEKGLDQ